MSMSLQVMINSDASLLFTTRKVRTGQVLGIIYPFVVITGLASIIAYVHLKVVNPKFLALGK